MSAPRPHPDRTGGIHGALLPRGLAAALLAGLLALPAGGLAQLGAAGALREVSVERPAPARGAIGLPPNLVCLHEVHALLTGQSRAAPDAAVSQIYAYQQAKAATLAMPGDTPREREARIAALGRAEALLEIVANRPLSARTIAAVEATLGLGPARN